MGHPQVRESVQLMTHHGGIPAHFQGDREGQKPATTKSGGMWKIQFHRTIKEIEQRLGDASVRLQSFIVSNTPSHTMQKLWNMDKPAMAARHILFQEEDKDTYVRSMLEAVGPAGTVTTAPAVPSYTGS
jgi:hypothetical protein